MAGKFFFIDTTRCTACRGCQIACKQYKKHDASKTKQYGTYQNPPDLDGNTFRLVRFSEHPAKVNSMAWYFFTEACRHCLKPACKKKADQIMKDAIIVHDKLGTVLFTKKTKELEKSFKAIKQSCPWSIPTWSKKEKQMVKCNMCFDRVEAGLLPACAKACPSGALNFGDEAEMKKLAKEHLAAAKKKFGGKGELLDFEDVRALYLITDEQSKYRPVA
jgi:formate dehydrogenase iron-sulfur subunit